MIFVSHSIGQIKKFCNKVLWLEYGTVKAFGTTEDVLPEYEDFIKAFKKMSKTEKSNYKKKILSRHPMN